MRTGLTIRKYAAHRRAAGLSGTTPEAVRKALAAGRITAEPDGGIDAAKADKAWAMNTDTAKVRAVSRKVERSPEPSADLKETAVVTLEGLAAMLSGASVDGRVDLALHVVQNFREMLPDLIPAPTAAVTETEETARQYRALVSVQIWALLEGWLSALLEGAKLPPIPWKKHFGADARIARQWFGQLQDSLNSGDSESPESTVQHPIQV